MSTVYQKPDIEESIVTSFLVVKVFANGTIEKTRTKIVEETVQEMMEGVVQVTIKKASMTLGEFMEYMELNHPCNLSRREYGMRDYRLLKLLDEDQLQHVISTDECNANLCERTWKTLAELLDDMFDI